MVICAGAVPVFADIDRATANIDPDEIEALVDDDVDAVMVTHLHGLICDMDRIKAICARHKLALIEDAAQSCGARMDGTFAGAFGDAGIFSFGMYKNINSFYGGMTLVRADETAQTIRREIAEFPLQDPKVLLKKVMLGAATDLATHPLIFRSFTYWLFRYAYLNDIEFLNRRVRIEDDPQLKRAFPDRYRNRMRPAQARLILEQFDDIDPFLRKRIEAARLYDDGLRGIPGLIVPPFYDDGRHSYLHYPIQLEDREALIRHMIKAGRDVAVQHLRDCSTLDCFADWHRDCPNSTLTAGQLTLLPTYPTYGAEQIRRNIDAIRDYFGVGRA
jgi:dTDP-4-amino-4,6-dideoxygalactose transaminase